MYEVCSDERLEYTTPSASKCLCKGGFECSKFTRVLKLFHTDFKAPLRLSFSLRTLASGCFSLDFRWRRCLAMSLTARHRWCAERILFCFTNNEDKENNEKFDDSKVQAFIRKPKVLAKFNDLFAGEGPAALFVHYQPRHINELEVGHDRALV